MKNTYVTPSVIAMMIDKEEILTVRASGEQPDDGVLKIKLSELSGPTE